MPFPAGLGVADPPARTAAGSACSPGWASSPPFTASRWRTFWTTTPCFSTGAAETSSADTGSQKAGTVSSLPTTQRSVCSYFIYGVSFRCRVDFRYSSSVRLTTELAVLENASPSVRQQAGSSGRDTTPGQPNACITSSCEMVTPSPLRTNAMMRVSSRKL